MAEFCTHNRDAHTFTVPAKFCCRNWPRGVVESGYVTMCSIRAAGQARRCTRHARAGTPILPILSSPHSTLDSQKWVLSKMSPTGQSKPRYEIHGRSSKSTGKRVVIAISARDKIRGFVPSNRVCHFVVKTTKPPIAEGWPGGTADAQLSRMSNHNAFHGNKLSRLAEFD